MSKKKSIDYANDLLKETEHSFQEKILEKLADRDRDEVEKPAKMIAKFTEIAELAKLAESALAKLADLVKEHDLPVATTPSQTGKYPRVERDGDFIIKVGWSKPRNKEYVHRAPSVVLMTVAEGLRDIGEFSVDGLRQIIPKIKSIPRYKVALAVWFFCSVGAVQRLNKGKYIAVKGQLSPEKVKEYFQALTPIEGNDE